MDVEAFAAFYQRNYRVVLTVAEQRLRGHTDAEDITAEVFRVAWRYAHDGNELSLSWVYQVLRNMVGNEYRRIARTDQMIEDAGPLLVANVVESASDDALDIREAMKLLPAEDRELLHMAYWEDLTGDEMAEILGCGRTAIRVRLTRAKKKLRAALEGEFVRKEGVRDGRA